MKVLSVVGARPQFVKLAPVAEAMTGAAHEHVIVHTGQHYDRAMSDDFFTDLSIPDPDVNLGVGSGPHGAQTAAMLAALEPVMEQHRPDWVLVYGDTNSTLAAAVCAVKLHLPLAHLEAGLRSFNRRMPEEHNRVLTDHAADMCLAPTEVAMHHLLDEGLAARARLVGDVMTDVLFRVRDAVRERPPAIPASVDGTTGFYLATVHRAENTDVRERLAAIADGLANLDRPVLLCAHPRLTAAARGHDIQLARGAVKLLPPQPYPALVNLMVHSAGVITDSGGLQKEAFLLRRPCTTLRQETEWTETVDLGWNVLVGDELSSSQLPRIVGRPDCPAVTAAPYGDGEASAKVVAALSTTAA